MDEYIKQFNKNTNYNHKAVAEMILNKTYLKIHQSMFLIFQILIEQFLSVYWQFSAISKLINSAEMLAV